MLECGVAGGSDSACNDDLHLWLGPPHVYGRHAWNEERRRRGS